MSCCCSCHEPTALDRWMQDRRAIELSQLSAVYQPTGDDLYDVMGLIKHEKRMYRRRFIDKTLCDPTILARFDKRIAAAQQKLMERR